MRGCFWICGLATVRHAVIDQGMAHFFGLHMAMGQSIRILRVITPLINPGVNHEPSLPIHHSHIFISMAGPPIHPWTFNKPGCHFRSGFYCILTENTNLLCVHIRTNVGFLEKNSSFCFLPNDILFKTTLIRIVIPPYLGRSQ